jgi:ABC-2 type transport system permease protein
VGAAQFFAALFLGGVLLASTTPLWVWTASMIEVDNYSVLSSYAGCLLVMAVFTAIGCLISSLTKNIITAYLVSVFVCWIVTYINMALGDGFGVSNVLWSKIVQSLNFFKHYQDMVSGQIGLDNVVYFISFTVLVLWANKVIVEYKKD